MKKGKTFKSVALVALSAVMVSGVAMAAAGCGGDGGGSGGGSSANDPVITVDMFSNDTDKATNQQIADNWAAAYNAENGTNYSVKIANQTDKAEYYNQLGNGFTNGTVGDVIYIAPRNVKVFAKSGRVIDLTQYIVNDAEVKENVNDIWPNCLAYYGFDTTKNSYLTNENGAPYTMGQSIEYKEDGAAGPGFYTTASSEKVGLFGLPKDYSNFSMGYNHRFFSDTLKEAYTTTKVNADRSVKGAKGDEGSPSATLTYTASTGSGVITYAKSGSYTNPVTGKTENVVEGQPAYIINIGVPVNIKPYNFYMYSSFTNALMAGDPMAVMADRFTGGKGYTVTLPGFPDETFEMPDGVAVDANASYDNKTGHIVYTYAEYGALLWSLTYYLNTFAWDGDGNTTLGGVKDSSGEYRTVYGGEQYEGGNEDGAQLYLLPWLFSNDADLINQASTFCTSFVDSGNMTVEQQEAARTDLMNAIQNMNLDNRQDWINKVGTAADTVEKLRLDGTLEKVSVQYGLNSQRFIETYAAFLAIGSDWNGNPGDSTNATKEGSGWDYFREGRGIFYGAGSWDPATRNEEDRARMDFGQMPTPVAERYALYSNVKGANYEMVTYSNGAGVSKTGVDGKQATGSDYKNADFDEYCKIYSADDIAHNLAIRQDKWGARMDSVGYAVSCKSTSTGRPGGTPTDKTAAAASLCIALTASADPQVALTYGGAQLPNFISQCEDLLNYQDPAHANGAFKDMITPDGDAQGRDVWDDYYAIAKEMGVAAYNDSNQTVAEFLNGKTIAETGEAVKYDPAFANTKLNKTDFAAATTTATSRISFAMKVLRMVSYRAKDFDILIRMQYGLNAVRDSSMYTYDDTWLNPHDARALPDQMLCYYRSRPLGSGVDLTKNETMKWNPQGAYSSTQFFTPAVFCLLMAENAQENLTKARTSEIQDLRSAGVNA